MVTIRYRSENQLLVDVEGRVERNDFATWWFEEGRERFASWSAARADPLGVLWREPNHEDD